MRKLIVFVLSLGIVFNIYATKLVETETKPNEKLKKIKSLALYKFDGKFINNGRLSLLNYLEISDKFHKYLLEKFQAIPDFEVTDAGERITVVESDKISVRRGKKSRAYDAKEFGNKEEISKDVVKTIEASLYGKITRFYKGENFETSYIEVVLYLVDTKTRFIYWVTRIKGCLKFVAETIVNTIVLGEYTEPTIEDIKRVEWKNPYELRVKDIALEYRRGYFMPLSDKLDSGGNHIFALYLKLPLFVKTIIYNQIEFNIIPSLKSTDKDNPLKDYQYTTYLPLLFDFVFNFDKYIKVGGLRPYTKLGLGAGFISTYYSGTGRYIETENQIDGIFCAGIGVEYALRIGPFRIWKLYGKINKLGFVGSIDYYRWFFFKDSPSGLNLSLGIKYYF